MKLRVLIIHWYGHCSTYDKDMKEGNEMDINLQYTLGMMMKYLAIPSPGGYTTAAIMEAKKDFEELGLETTLTNKKALIATLRGENDEEHRMISAHIDTLGAMVKEIDSDGRLKYHRIGGGCWNAVEGENCTVLTADGKKIRGSILPRQASSHVYFMEAYDTRRDEKSMVVRLDERVSSKQDVLDLGIRVGDFIYMDTRTELTESGFLKTRYIDNKSAVAATFAIAKYFKDNNIVPPYTTHLFISNYEECGHGVAGIPEKTKEMIAVDIGTVGEGQTSSEFAVSIAAKDRVTPYNFEFRRRLEMIAKEHDVDYEVDVYHRYASDATQVVTSSIDIDFACLGPGVDATHHYERCHISAIENTVKLLVGYVLSK